MITTTLKKCAQHLTVLGALAMPAAASSSISPAVKSSEQLSSLTITPKVTEITQNSNREEVRDTFGMGVLYRVGALVGFFVAMAFVERSGFFKSLNRR